MKPIPSEQATHPAHDALLNEADHLLEQYDFAGSVTAFREAALLAPLGDVSLDNLLVAEENERVEFRRRLVQMFPESLDLAMAEVATLVRAKLGPQAVARCTHLLTSRAWTPRQILLIRHARFEAARAARDPATFAADFVALWRETFPSKHGARVRLGLIRTLLEVSSPALLGALGLIRDQIEFEPALTRIIDGKTEQLTYLHQLESQV